MITRANIRCTKSGNRGLYTRDNRANCLSIKSGPFLYKIINLKETYSVKDDRS